MRITHMAFVTIASVFLVSTVAGAAGAQPRNHVKRAASYTAQERFQHQVQNRAAVAGTPLPEERLDRWEDRWDRRENVRDRREDRRDRREDVRDRREDRRDRMNGYTGPADRLEDIRDRREDRWDRRENVRDRREDRRDRREDRRDGPLGPGPMPAPSGTPEVL